MLALLKELFDKEELLAARFGIEREALRVTKLGKLAMTSHPAVFGNKLEHPYITTDFSESQIELITPSFESAKETYQFLNALYDMTALNIGEEILWPQSMPCDIPEDEQIPIARYADCEKCLEARKYREALLKKYGGKKQLISGVHYNFSFEGNILSKLYEKTQGAKSFTDYKNAMYLKVVRNYLRYRWLLIYLTGASPVFHKSFATTCTKTLDLVDSKSYSNEGAISYRNSAYGYCNKQDLYPDYTSLESYVESLEQFVAEGILESHKEFYSPIRLKARNNDDLLHSLRQDGVLYVEIRCIDTNPFEKSGMSLEDIEFLHLFMFYLLTKEEQDVDINWQAEGNENQRLIATQGLLDIHLSRNGKPIRKVDWALEILEEMLHLDQELGLGKAAIILEKIEMVKKPERTYAARIKAMCKEQGYLKAQEALANKYRAEAYANRYKLCGYEDMELSTQILMKEAMLRGIQVEVLDRADQFIALKLGEHIEYVKQATKTSKDSYMTMLMMENKTVTKKILARHQICVPEGTEVFKGDNLSFIAKQYAGKAIVVKPKSTNFGTGISIFPEGASSEDIIRALEIGFEHDQTVLIEAFAKGKEYRFLVIGDEVAGILHRVPANVIGDGKSSIRELVAIKNEDSLRGKGYKTPLEKIRLDESSALFLKQSGLDFDYVPQVEEIVYLRENSNISTGGDSIDYTDTIPQRFKDIAVDAAKAVGAKFCGVDMMLEDYQDEKAPYAIIELNFNPAIHIHSYPYQGTERNIAEKVLKVLGFITA